ncbi:MAG: thioredoxin family protein [Anaerolineae bacterium]|nr:thioredoxin family protein [Anaerolineae bacterium]
MCREVLTAVEVGKCASCELTERNLARDFASHKEAVGQYDVRSVPTIVIDGCIKVEGRPEFPWMCGDEFYEFLHRHYPLKPRNNVRPTSNRRSS